MELLAPAGTEKAVIAAVQSGADAIYIGGGFSARRAAENFDLEALRKTVSYCHLRGVKVHVAANILIKEQETDAFLSYIGALNAMGVDAVIIQDLGVAKEVRKMYPDLPLHGSTQMTVASLDGVRYLEELGFSRVVLARELSKKEIAYIKKHARAELEVFCHGAICACFSGQCLMSSIIGGRSGNRGMCAQPCRLPYELLDQDQVLKKGYILSPKDMALVSHLQELEELGVDSLKIEGRLKRPEYVAAVTGIYRKYIDNPVPVSESDMQELLHAFNRSGFTDFYFKGQTGAGMMSYDQPGNSADNAFSDLVKARCEEHANFRNVPVSMEAILRRDEPITLTIWDDDGNVASVCGTINAEQAQNKPLDEVRFREQLEKLGQTVFQAGDINIIMDDGITVPIREINETRRRAVELLEEQRTAVPIRQVLDRGAEQKQSRNSVPTLSVQVQTRAQLEVAQEMGIQRIYAPMSLYKEYEKTVPELVAVLPPVDRNKIHEKFERVLVSNIGQIHAHRGAKLYGDFRLNVMNASTCAALEELEVVTLSPELQLREVAAIETDVEKEVLVYGRLPLMVLGNCPVKSVTGGCHKSVGQYVLKDRMREEFPILCQDGCIPGVFNSKPLYMADKMQDLLRLGVSGLRLYFTVEDRDTCKKIIMDYKRALAGEKVLAPEENTFTRGHFYRGVQ